MAKWPHHITIYKLSDSTNSYGEPTHNRSKAFESDADLQGAMSLRDMMDLGVEDQMIKTVFVRDPIPSDIRPSDEVEWDGWTGRIVQVDHHVENSMEVVFEM